jgi:hypothetical protein
MAVCTSAVVNMARKVQEITKKGNGPAEGPPKLTTSVTAAWKRWDFAYARWYGDYGATAHVDFRARQFDGHTVVFVFMYTNFSSQEAKIRSMLESFTWKGKGSQEHSVPKKASKGSQGLLLGELGLLQPSLEGTLLADRLFHADQGARAR